VATPAEQQAGFSARQARVNTRLDWFGAEVAGDVTRTMASRIKLASQLVRDKTVANISRPVTKIKTGGGRGEGGRFKASRTAVTDRSVPGEFPRADTTRLMKDAFFEVTTTPTGTTGVIGTTLDYGLILETRRNRSFLRRTLSETRNVITIMLTSGRPPFPSDN